MPYECLYMHILHADLSNLFIANLFFWLKIKDKCIHHNLFNPSFYHFYQVFIASSDLIAFHELVHF